MSRLLCSLPLALTLLGLAGPDSCQPSGAYPASFVPPQPDGTLLHAMNATAWAQIYAPPGTKSAMCESDGTCVVFINTPNWAISQALICDDQTCRLPPREKCSCGETER